MAVAQGGKAAHLLIGRFGFCSPYDPVCMPNFLGQEIVALRCIRQSMNVCIYTHIHRKSARVNG